MQIYLVQNGANAAIHVDSDMNSVERVGKRKGEIKSAANYEDCPGWENYFDLANLRPLLKTLFLPDHMCNRGLGQCSVKGPKGIPKA